MFTRGYLPLFRVRGVPVRAHWSLPVGVLVFTGFRLAPGAWLGMVLLILLHELGHAALVSRAGLVNLGIDLTGFGGQCRFVGQPAPRQRAAIAWGGVLAQFAVLAVALPTYLVLAPTPGFANDLLDSLTRVNLMLAALNLIPIAPLDGAQAWPWFTHFADDRRRRRSWKQKLTPQKDGGMTQTLQEALDEADREHRS